jgi:hypothetical protein
MTPILGIMASGMSGNLWAPGKDFDSIATTTVGAGGVASITFSSIPQTYRHLQIRLSSNAGGNDVFYQFNSDTGANYTRHFLYGTGAAAAAGSSLSVDSGSIGYVASTANTNIFGAAIMDVLDYTNTSKNTTTRSLTGFDANGSGLIVLYSGLWLNTAAVSSIVMRPYAGNFNQYTSAALYGIK